MTDPRPPSTLDLYGELNRRAEALMRLRQWSQAAAAFAQVPLDARDAALSLKHRLSTNLAALQQHRPAVYDLLLSLPAQHSFAIGATASGKPSINYRHPDGTVGSFTGGPDPVAAVAAALPRIYQQTPAGEAIALCGIGDGYLTQLLAQRPQSLFMDKQQPVFLIEPEPQIVLQCLMIHDFTGPAGPIEHERFHWFVGAGWDQAIERKLLDDPFLPWASVTVSQGFNTQHIQAALRSIAQCLLERDADLTAKIDRHYARLDPADFVPMFKGLGSRPPRVLLVTTRFSTVLQYSTRDTATAFERMGWEARVVMEPSPHHRVLRSAIATVLAEFRPDLVFQIDHLRNEHQGLFPATLPFVCWIQDHLPHLARREMGRQVGELDFVLTDAIATYVDKFDYPPRQCIPLPKLVVRTEPACLSESDDGPVDDLVFVSNASGAADTMVAEAYARFARTSETTELITQCCRSIVATYERGDSLPTYNHICAVLRQTLSQLSLSLGAEAFDVLARWLTHPFNDALYRQQALTWAVDVAREQGLTLGLYGKGWEAHPRFAPFARGPIQYGETLRRLTRRSRINLQVVPYLCLHQRLLDGLMAGGFFLVRTHPADVAPASLLRFLDQHDPLAAARAAQLADLIEQCRPCLCTTGAEDVVAMVRAWEAAGQLTVADGPLPMLNEVAFGDALQLADRARRYHQSPALRESVVATQRRSVSARLSYDAGIRRVAMRIGELIEQTAATNAAPGRLEGIAA